VNAYLLTFAFAAVLSLFLTRICRDLAIRASWVDVPDAGRKRHAGPTPAVGGLALAVSTTLALLLARLVSVWPAAQQDDPIRLVPICILGMLMMFVGLVDDLRSLRPAWKFAMQAAVAVAAWMVGIRIESLGAYWGDGFRAGILSLPITVVWIVGITNAFNLLDGLDGLAAGRRCSPRWRCSASQSRCTK